MKNFVLIGMPATGKSTVGVILAKRLGYDFLDTDIAICKTTGRTLPVLLEQEGVPFLPDRRVDTARCLWDPGRIPDQTN